MRGLDNRLYAERRNRTLGVCLLLTSAYNRGNCETGDESPGGGFDAHRM